MAAAEVKLQHNLPAASTIKLRADREGWVRKATLRQLNAAAHRLAHSKSGGEDNPSIDSVEERAAKLLEHRADWPAIRASIQQAVADLESAPQRAAELIQRERDAQAVKPVSKRKDLGIRDELAILRTVLVLAKTKLESLMQAAGALQVVQTGERRAWGLDEAADGDSQFTDEDRAKLDALYVEAIDGAQKQAEEMAERMRAISAMVAAGSTGALH
ncbi:hypothetical protein IP84_00730 [beta proteobacterium AAP99]|nr:hypothetical protein IP84_00730 [beta proteobacterium AAP99]